LKWFAFVITRVTTKGEFAEEFVTVVVTVVAEAILPPTPPIASAAP
jgi:hypothetical protein